ncbi:MAG: hypothetical protein DMF56_23730 [Acidobacteria bacterium]|nr:MAG: hypothetical protein DMF56_23730 [Acidobacteriota bacterium]
MKSRFVLAFTFIVFTGIARADDMTDAQAWLNSQPQPIAFNYDTECNPLTEGSQKFGCRLVQFPQAGLVICQNTVCNPNIATEIAALQAIAVADMRIVPFIDQVYSFQCRGSRSSLCLGYILRWYGSKEGGFYKPTRSGESPFIIAVKKLATPLQGQTCTDIHAIWAHWSKGEAIGDFQGVLEFATGHFFVADPTGYPVKPSSSQTKALQRVCNAICGKSNKCN